MKTFKPHVALFCMISGKIYVTSLYDVYLIFSVYFNQSGSKKELSLYIKNHKDFNFINNASNFINDDSKYWYFKYLESKSYNDFTNILTSINFRILDFCEELFKFNFEYYPRINNYIANTTKLTWSKKITDIIQTENLIFWSE
jgi:hypothetical protein